MVYCAMANETCPKVLNFKLKRFFSSSAQLSLQIYPSHKCLNTNIKNVVILIFIIGMNFIFVDFIDV